MTTKEAPEIATREWFTWREGAKLMKLNLIVCNFCECPGAYKNEKNEIYCVQCAKEEAAEMLS